MADLDTQVHEGLSALVDDAEQLIGALSDGDAAITDRNASLFRELVAAVSNARALVADALLAPPLPAEKGWERPIYGVRAGKAGRSWL